MLLLPVVRGVSCCVLVSCLRGCAELRLVRHFRPELLLLLLVVLHQCAAVVVLPSLPAAAAVGR